MIQTTTIIPPQITSLFDAFLLDPLYGLWKRVEDKIKPLAKRKIRDQDVGKRREFKELTIRFQETYERKKIEKENYDAKIKNSAKRPSIPATGGTMRFRRYES